VLSGGKRITILTAGNLNRRHFETSRVLSRDLKIIIQVEGVLDSNQLIGSSVSGRVRDRA
jgi:hypothetical protein